MSNPGKYGHNFTAYNPCTKASRKCANGRVFRTQTDAIIPGVFYIGYAKVLTLTYFYSNPMYVLYKMYFCLLVFRFNVPDNIFHYCRDRTTASCVYSRWDNTPPLRHLALENKS